MNSKIVPVELLPLMTKYTLPFKQSAKGSFHYNSTQFSEVWNHMVWVFVPFRICLQLQISRKIDTNFAKID